MILSMKTENFFEDLKNLEVVFDFSNPDVNHEVYSNKNEKVVGKFKIVTLKKGLDDFVCLRSKAFSFKGKDIFESRNKIKRNF